MMTGLAYSSVAVSGLGRTVVRDPQGASLDRLKDLVVAKSARRGARGGHVTVSLSLSHDSD